MKNVKLNLLLIFSLIFCLSYQGYADCPRFVESNTKLEAAGSKTGKGFWKIISLDWSNIDFDKKLLQFIKVTAVNNQGPEGYFDPKIKVCDYEGNDNCYILSTGTFCHQIYGTQSTGAGVSAAAFIDWEGDKTKAGGEIAQGLGWEWADGVTDEEKRRFTNSPKICACSQKGACMEAFFGGLSRIFSGENIFRPGNMENVCDTCSWNGRKQKVKCAPVPLAPGPPPFCEQLAMSPPRVRIVPIRNQDNDYFNPRVGVIIGELKERREIYVPSAVSNHKNIPNWTYPISDKDTIHYFKTYRKKGRLCAEYSGTEREESKRKLQFPARCFPAPPAPKPEEIKVVNGNTLEVRMKMSENVCTYDARGTHNNGVCTFNVNANSSTHIGHLPLKVVKPAIVEKTTNSSNRKSDIDNIIEGILKNNSQFEVLEKYGYVPNIETECKEYKDGKCKRDNLGYPKIEVKYKENPKSKMLCLSGWQLEPEEFVLEKGSELISLKSVGASYAKHNTVYSKESNQLYYFPCNETIEVLAKPQDALNEIIFNKKGYISIPAENKPRDNCTAKEDKEVDTKQNCDKCKIVYELIDGKYEEKNCNHGDDGCLCFDGVCNRSTQYVNKDNKPFYLRVSQDENGVVKKLDHPIKANRTEVFYADKLCRFDLEGLKKRLREIIVAQLKGRKQELERSNKESYELGDGYTNDLSMYDYVEIEAWGGGEAGHIIGKAQSTVSKQGRPGDYIKAKLKINPDYPYIKVKVTEGGGGQEDYKSNKDGGPTLIKMCRDPSETICKDLITVAGGGTYRTYGKIDHKETIIHEESLKLEEEVVKGDELNSREDNKIAYIRNGEIRYENVKKCSKSYANKIYGAGGCINKSKGTYGKGALGHVKIKPMFEEINKERVKKIDDAIEKMIQNPDDITGIDDSLINKLDQKIIDTIKEEIRKELLGL
ncbi:hypothetical protein [Wolbachia endosymbiont (group B) of Gerris lacustris]|uniref:hypothetical protein n=1 Tax=Wolbachia endosymbiont (group B) of Gerris lacustris TaxID=3066159 RepID=UPI00333E273B